ncbi:MAG: endonuclease/exonuclease/phosphatase family protein [Firmicutes bacterium]|nr:endonuclease/exonuclease/phosphatase family protein [Bacillota bacterium]
MARSVGKRAKKERSLGGKMLKVFFSILMVLVLVVGAYVAYAMISYHRIEDYQQCKINNAKEIAERVPVDRELSLQSWNIGFAAYQQDYSFFMDGGKESRARSKEAVYESMGHIVDGLKDTKSDFYTVQEVDFDSTRTYHVDEAQIIRDSFTTYSNTFAQNYDSPYLMWPLIKPHGASKSGILTMSKFEMQSSIRRSLPIQTDLAKFIDLDRCYDVVRYEVEDGHELVLINLHLSAYTTDPTIADQQVEMLCKEIEKEYAKGNYVICAGDYNKDMLGNSSEVFENEGERGWAKAFKKDMLPEGFSVVNTLDSKNPVASCRDCDTGYVKGETFVVTVDGFIVSDNIEVVKAETLDYEFMWSDHNPVRMVFKLLGGKFDIEQSALNEH